MPAILDTAPVVFDKLYPIYTYSRLEVYLYNIKGFADRLAVELTPMASINANKMSSASRSTVLLGIFFILQ
jgi:hypothetical protein